MALSSSVYNGRVHAARFESYSTYCRGLDRAKGRAAVQCSDDSEKRRARGVFGNICTSGGRRINKASKGNHVGEMEQQRNLRRRAQPVYIVRSLYIDGMPAINLRACSG